MVETLLGVGFELNSQLLRYSYMTTRNTWFINCVGEGAASRSSYFLLCVPEDETEVLRVRTTYL